MRSGNKNIVIAETNLFKNEYISNKHYPIYFSEYGYQETLASLIRVGEYMKTKKRKVAMYCFGSTIACTQFPKFSYKGRPQILPRPYNSYKPGTNGYTLIR